MSARSYAVTGEDRFIDQSAKYANSTGLCPICHTRPCGIGITCGDIGCLHHWLPGGDRTMPIDRRSPKNAEPHGD